MKSMMTTAMGNLWTDTNSPKTEMTARDMALISHNLTARGMKATTSNGETYYWVQATERWTR